MGLEIEVDSLEDMCALMCDNRLPRKRKKKNKEKGAHQIAPSTPTPCMDSIPLKK